MKLAVSSFHAPQAEGSAGGRQLWAVGEALRALGHEVSCLCWQPSEPSGLPSWAEWRPVPPASSWRVRTTALVRPRTDAARLGWDPPQDAVVLADDVLAFGAVGTTSAAVAVHYDVRLDTAAERHWSPRNVQDLRAQRRAVARAHTVLTFSERVSAALGTGTVVPATVPFPDEVLAPVEAPVVGLLANWTWRPNLTAAGTLLRLWPEVRAHVPGAELVLGGRGPCPVGATEGVRWLGEVSTAADLLAQVSLLAFPCRNTSGPKMKTLDALAHGVPVVTSTGGAEGVHPSDGLVVTTDDRLVGQLVSLLRDPHRRSAMAAAARAGMDAHHSPRIAALARVAALSS